MTNISYQILHKNNKNEFDKILSQVSYGRGVIQAFNDFLDVIINLFLVKDDLDLIKNPLSRYEKIDIERVREMTVLLGKITEKDGEQYYDALGDLFMEYISQGKNDQYFTPQSVANVNADILLKDVNVLIDQKVIDSACGSGRLLLGVARHNKDLKFYGWDIELSCVKMAVINLAINHLRGAITWGNPMTEKVFANFIVMRDFKTNYPMIYITKDGDNI